MKPKLVSLTTLFSLLFASLNWMLSAHQAWGKAIQQTRKVFRTYAPFWKVDDGFSSAIIIRNADRQSPLSATPILFTPDKKQLRLPAIQLAPNSVKKFSLQDYMRESGAQVDWGAIALEFDQPNPPSVIAQVVISNYQRGLLFDFPFHSGYTADQAKALHASWWLPDKETEGTIVLFNTSDKKISARLSVAANWSELPAADLNLAPHEVKMLDLKGLLRHTGIRDAEIGSLRLNYDGPPHALLPALLLSNQKTGFSMTGKFFAKPTKQASAVTDWNFPAVFADSSDPGLGFKKGMKFKPYALISNATDELIVAQLEADFQMPASGIAQSLNLTSIALAPMETRLVDLSEYLTREMKEVPNFSLRLSHSGAAGDLAVHVFSTDQNKKFVFAAEGATDGSTVVDSVYWDITGDLQSLLTVQNVSASELKVRVVLRYSIGSEQTVYRLPLFELPARASRVINLRQVIAAGKPDEDGRVIPPNISFGTASVEASEGSGALIGGSVTFDPDAGKYGGFFLPWCSPEGITILLDGIELPPCIDFLILLAPVIICEFACDGGEPAPSVTISGPNKVPLDASGEPGVEKSIQLTAAGDPPGGTFSWSTTSQKVSLSNTNSATVTVTSVSASTSRNDVTITVTYTVNGQSASASTQITVVKPTSLQLTSNTFAATGHTCDPATTMPTCQRSGFQGGGIYTSYLRELRYDVMDQFSPAQAIKGVTMFFQESFTTPTGPCAGPPITGTGMGDTITDCFYFCSETCRTGGSCNVSATQAIKVNGFTVATKMVTWTCTGVTVQ